MRLDLMSRMTARARAALGMVVLFCALAGWPAVGWGQAAPPFYYPGPTPYEAEISVVNTGVLQDVQAVVGPDPRYVTLGMQPANSSLLALRQFAFASTGNVGYVGGIKFPSRVAAEVVKAKAATKPGPNAAPISPWGPAPAEAATSWSPPTHIVNPPVVLGNGNGLKILETPGMTPVAVK